MLHLVDNTELTPVSSKVAKIQPIHNVINTASKQFSIFHILLSVDESMVPYYGQHSRKMSIKWKPIRFGYKIWVLCGSDGYPNYLELYTGKSDEPLSIGNRVVQVWWTWWRTIHTLISTSYTATISSPVTTFYQIWQHEIWKTIGTIRENRTMCAAKAMKSGKDLKKSDRETFDYRFYGNVYFCKWNDNSIVNTGSIFSTHL